MSKLDTMARDAAMNMITEYGAHGAILALSSALRELGPNFVRAAVDVEAVTGHAPFTTKDLDRLDAQMSCDCGGFVQDGAFVHADRCDSSHRTRPGVSAQRGHNPITAALASGDADTAYRAAKRWSGA